jgi:DNA-binding MarR family transcriptional regulator
MLTDVLVAEQPHFRVGETEWLTPSEHQPPGVTHMNETYASESSGSRKTPTDRGIIADMLQSLRSSGDDMTAQQLLTLLFVSSHGAQALTSLSDALHLSESTIAALYPRLVARGLIIGIPAPSTPEELAIMLSSAGHRFVDNLIYRQGRSSGAFPRVPVTNDDLHRRNDEALRLT